MSKKTSSKKSATSSKKTASKKTATRRPTMSEQADAAARAAEGLPVEEYKGASRYFPGARLPTKAKKAAAPKTEKAPKAEKEPAARRETVTSVSEDLIRAGKTNEEILVALVKQFPDFDAAKKKHYPQWYRARMARNEK